MVDNSDEIGHVNGTDAPGGVGDGAATEDSAYQPVQRLLDRGIKTARQGDRARARRYLEEALARDPKTEDAWLWLAALSQDVELARVMYERVLAINPGNTRAREALRRLEMAPAATDVALSMEDRNAQERDALDRDALDRGLPESVAHGDDLSQDADGESGVDRQALGRAELEGPALFVPPWEMDTPVPILRAESSLDDDEAGASATPSEAGASGTLVPADKEDDIEPLEASESKDGVPASMSSEQVDPGQQRQRQTIDEDAGADDVERVAALWTASMAPERTAEIDASLAGKSNDLADGVTGLAGTDLPEDLSDMETADGAQVGAYVRGSLFASRVLRNGLMLSMLSFIFIGSGMLLFFIGDTSRADQARVVLGAVTRTPTPTSTPTWTLTPTISPTPTHTPTLTPTQTLTPSPTPSPTMTYTPAPTPTPKWVTGSFLPLPTDGKWIEVDLSEQWLRAYEGTEVVFEAQISSGRRNTPTVKGKYRITRKLESQLMTGPGYYLPNVPYVQYFHGAYALHGAYWHNNFGTPTSHGCVNLKHDDAKWLYYWTDPVVPEGARTVNATSANPGTWVLIHD